MQQIKQRSRLYYLIQALAIGTLCVAGPVCRADTPSTEGKTTYNSITVSDAQQDFAYALVSIKDGSNIMSANSADVREIEAQRKLLKRDFLWYRQAQHRHLITDQDTLLRAQSIWQPVRVLNAERDKPGKQMDELDQKQRAAVKLAESQLRELLLH